MPKKKKEAITGILIGDAAQPEKAKLISETYSVCPYCCAFFNTGKNVIGVFAIPKENKWWLNWVADQPYETIGLKTAAVFFTSKVKASCSWLRGELVPTQQKAPCGAQCWECTKYLNECKGCPSTLYHLANQST